MQILVLIACTAVLLAAGTNAASFVNPDQSQLQYNAMEIEEAELNTEEQPPLPFPCTPDYEYMYTWQPKDILVVEAPSSICFAVNGDFAVASDVGWYSFFIFDENRNLKMKGNYPDGAYIITGCAFSSTALYFADRGEKKIYKYTLDGEYVETFLTGFKFGRLAAADGNLYAVVDDIEVAAYNETDGQKTCSITTFTSARALAFDTKGNLNVAFRGNRIEAYMLNCTFVSSRVYPEVGATDGLAFDGSNNTVILDGWDRKVKVFSPPPYSSLFKELGPYADTVPTDVGIGKDCSLYVVDLTTHVVYVY